MESVGIGLVGFGTIGSGVAQILLESGGLLQEKTGTQIQLRSVCDLDVESKRPVTLPKGLLTDDCNRILNDPQISIVVELIGGVDAARKLTLAAIDKGKHVVTANKALLAKYGRELCEAAWAKGVCIMFEASVGGGIPIISAVREGFVANHLESIFGIVNGTSNFILSKMFRENVDYADALKEAQELGYAEADPALDVGGGDSAHKLAILARLGFAVDFDDSDITVEGIDGLELVDIQFAREFDHVIKLLAIGKQTPRGLELRVHPTLLPQSHPLATVNGVFNAIFVRGDAVGESMLYGRGAGMMPTASAVVSDIVSIALGNGPRAFEGLRVFPGRTKQVKVLPAEEIESRYYLRFKVKDRPGVLSAISGVLAKNSISIVSAIQQGRSEYEAVPVLLITHFAKERGIREALREIDGLDSVVAPTKLIRVED